MAVSSLTSELHLGLYVFQLIAADPGRHIGIKSLNITRDNDFSIDRKPRALSFIIYTMIGAYFLAGAPIQNSYPSGYLPYYLILPYQPELQPAPYIQYPLPSSETTEVTTKRVTTSEKEIRSEPKKKTVGRKKKKGECFGLFPLKIRIIILGVPKKKVQNPERNVLTNICSQLMSFLLSKQKCGPIF